MTIYRVNDLLRDPDGRLLKLVDFVDSVGDIGPYWRAVTIGPNNVERRRSSIRANRLHRYNRVDR